jgi:hypothetical protein
MILKKYIQFINEKVDTTIYDLKVEIAAEIVHFQLKYAGKLHPVVKWYEESDHLDQYELLTAREPYTIWNDTDGFEARVDVKDRYRHHVNDKEELQYILECIKKYERFMDMNPKIGAFGFTEGIAKALSGSLEDEKMLFKSIPMYKFKWDGFSDELIATLTDEEKIFLKSYMSGSKYNIFESNEEENWNPYIYKMKKMPAFSREKHAVGRGFWSWDPTWFSGSFEGIAINEFGPVKYWSGGAEYERIKDPELIKNIKNSIDSTYSYMFEQEEHNKLYNTVRSFIMNYDEDYDAEYDKWWKNLFDYLVGKKLFQAIDEIYWNDSAFDGDKENIIRSAKGLSKYKI